MKAAHTLDIRGQALTVRSDRRYAVVTFRARPVPHPNGGILVPFARCESTTDDVNRARRAAIRHNDEALDSAGTDVWCTVVDLTTGTDVL